MRAQNIYTVEQLAAIDGQELKNLGPGGREQKNQAEEFIAEPRQRAEPHAIAAELEALRARNAGARGGPKSMAQRARHGGGGRRAAFDDMTDEQLRDYITANTGHAPAATSITRR